MASGDTVYSESALRVWGTATGSDVVDTNGQGWTVELKLIVSGQQKDTITLVSLPSSPEDAPFDITKTYDVIIKEH